MGAAENFNFRNEMMKNLLTVVVFAASPVAAHAAQVQQGDALRAQSKAAMCIGCHGIPDYKAAFPEVYRVPKLGGQSAQYLQNTLQAYKKGDRKHPTMRGVAGSLSDQDIDDLAAYYAAQNAGTPNNPLK